MDQPETGILLSGTPCTKLFPACGRLRRIASSTTRPPDTRRTKARSVAGVRGAAINAYALIGRLMSGIAPVSGLALVYTEPVNRAKPQPESMSPPESDGFAMGFSANIVERGLEAAKWSIHCW